MKEIEKFYKAAFSLSNIKDNTTSNKNQNWFFDNPLGRTTRRMIGDEKAKNLSEEAKKTMNFMRGVNHKVRSGFGNFMNTLPIPMVTPATGINFNNAFTQGMMQTARPGGTSQALNSWATHMLQGLKPVSLSQNSFGTNLANIANNVKNLGINSVTQSPFFGGQRGSNLLGQGFGGLINLASKPFNSLRGQQYF